MLRKSNSNKIYTIPLSLSLSLSLDCPHYPQGNSIPNSSTLTATKFPCQHANN